MYMSAEVKQQTELIWAQQEGVIAERIERASVKISTSKMRGSGVLAKIAFDGHARPMVMIVSSRRNLFRHAGYLGDPSSRTPPKLGSFEAKAMFAEFLNQCSVAYGDGQLAGVQRIGGFGHDWGNDLLLLFSTDKDLLQYARIHAVFNHAEAIRRHRLFYSGMGPFGGVFGDHFHCFQAGFGGIEASRDQSGGYFHCRSTALQGTKTQTVLQRETGQVARYENVWLLEADPANQMAPGDTGGGVFAVTDPKHGDSECYLLGIAVGANFLEDELCEGEPVRNVAATHCIDVLSRTFSIFDHQMETDETD